MNTKQKSTNKHDQLIKSEPFVKVLKNASFCSAETPSESLSAGESRCDRSKCTTSMGVS